VDCDSTFGLVNDVKTLAELQKEKDAEDKKRAERLQKQNLKSTSKKLKYTQAEAQQLYAENQRLQKEVANSDGTITVLLLITISLAVYIIYDKAYSNTNNPSTSRELVALS